VREGIVDIDAVFRCPRDEHAHLLIQSSFGRFERLRASFNRSLGRLARLLDLVVYQFSNVRRAQAYLSVLAFDEVVDPPKSPPDAPNVPIVVGRDICWRDCPAIGY
jgi:hypothetical protein